MTNLRIYLKNIYGFNWRTIKKIYNFLKIPENSNVNELNYLTKLNKILTLKFPYLTETQLKKLKKNYINNKIKNKSYKGYRHLYNLSVNGQNTKNNCKTQKKKS